MARAATRALQKLEAVQDQADRDAECVARRFRGQPEVLGVILGLLEQQKTLREKLGRIDKAIDHLVQGKTRRAATVLERAGYDPNCEALRLLRG